MPLWSISTSTRHSPLGFNKIPMNSHTMTGKNLSDLEKFLVSGNIVMLVLYNFLSLNCQLMTFGEKKLFLFLILQRNVEINWIIVQSNQSDQLIKIVLVKQQA